MSPLESTLYGGLMAIISSTSTLAFCDSRFLSSLDKCKWLDKWKTSYFLMLNLNITYPLVRLSEASTSFDGFWCWGHLQQSQCLQIFLSRHRIPGFLLDIELDCSLPTFILFICPKRYGHKIIRVVIDWLGLHCWNFGGLHLRPNLGPKYWYWCWS